MAEKKEKKTPREQKPPRWWKNSFFWFAALLAALSIVGFVRGDAAILDPGQVLEGNLAWYYLAGSIIMLMNGMFTHLQAVQHFNEAKQE